MKNLIFSVFILFFISGISQEGKPQDYLSSEFHKGRREALREKMPANSVAVFFANPVRNRANDVDYVYHQDPDFFYLTGYKEPHAVLVLFSEEQTGKNGKKYDEVLYVQKKNPRAEMWTGYRLGVEGAKKELGFNTVYNGKEFLNNKIDFSEFERVYYTEIG
tara:strand:- start:1382 stop:1867 length:486 start_codon:yes stop_codon:yes gene_type:complete